MPRISSLALLSGACLLAACRTEKPETNAKTNPTRPPQAITIAVAADELVAPIREIVAEFAALSHDDVSVVAAESDAAAAADLIFFPADQFAAWAPKLDGGLLRQPSENENSLDEPQIVRELLCNWDERTIAAPLTAPSLYLAVRRDVLARYEAGAPSDWTSYAHLAKTLRGDGSQDAAASVVEPLAPGWAAHTLLTRAAAYAKHPNYFGALFEGDEMRPRIADPPFERALRELIDTVGLNSPSLELTCDDVRQRLYSGEAAIGLCWPQPSEAVVGDHGVNFYAAPGSPEVYHPRDQRWMTRNDDQEAHVPYLGDQAWVFGVGADSGSPAAALQLARWLAQSPRRTLVAPTIAAAPVRFSDLGASDAWCDGGAAAAASFAKAAEEVLHARDGLGPLRIPGADRYLAALDAAVRAAAAGKSEPSDALAAAAKEWDAITEELGREAQAKLYRASVARPAP